MKSDLERFDEAVQYIHQRVDSALAQHIVTTARAGNVSRSSLGDDISLGSRADKKNSPTFDDNTAQRQALRALLLCQRVYFSKIWAQEEVAPAGNAAAAFVNVDMYPRATANWKATKAASVALWGGQSEAEIMAGIKTFTITSGRPVDAAAAARRPGEATLKLPVLDLTRADDPFPGHGTCYSAVMFWLFRAGIVSYRWMMLHSRADLEQPGLVRAFGPGTVIWPADRPFGPNDHLPAVPHGHIVHLYVDNFMQWKGHWLISCGDGTAFGRNNDEEGGRKSRYYDRCSLDNQFLAYKGSVLDQGGRNLVLKGVAAVHDPINLPGRL